MPRKASQRLIEILDGMTGEHVADPVEHLARSMVPPSNGFCSIMFRGPGDDHGYYPGGIDFRVVPFRSELARVPSAYWPTNAILKGNVDALWNINAPFFKTMRGALVDAMKKQIAGAGVVCCPLRGRVELSVAGVRDVEYFDNPDFDIPNGTAEKWLEQYLMSVPEEKMFARVGDDASLEMSRPVARRNRRK